MTDFKCCENCRFQQSASFCCKYFDHCKRIAELEAALAKYTDEIFECENNEDFHGHTIITVEDKRKARAGK
jgi:hypothetical protein